MACLFLDISGVLLINGWDHRARRRAAKMFQLDFRRWTLAITSSLALTNWASSVTKKPLEELHRISPNDPDHLPREIELIETFRHRHPKLSQVACFDTAFHQTTPHVARLLPIPRRFDAKGIQRYGFYGLSYAYPMEELARLSFARRRAGRERRTLAVSGRVAAVRSAAR